MDVKDKRRETFCTETFEQIRLPLSLTRPWRNVFSGICSNVGIEQIFLSSGKFRVRKKNVGSVEYQKNIITALHSSYCNIWLIFLTHQPPWVTSFPSFFPFLCHLMGLFYVYFTSNAVLAAKFTSPWVILLQSRQILKYNNKQPKI